MSKKKRIQDLEKAVADLQRRIKELEDRPVYIPIAQPQPTTVPSTVPWIDPYQPYIEPHDHGGMCACPRCLPTWYKLAETVGSSEPRCSCGGCFGKRDSFTAGGVIHPSSGVKFKVD